MDSDDSVQCWLQDFIASTYVLFDCDWCRTKRQCSNHFCITCRKGSLCALQFIAGGPHEGHPFLQVRKLTGKYIVEERDLVKHFINTKLLQKFIANSQPACFLKRSPKDASKKERHLRKCHHCKGSMQSGAGDGKVCSIQCLLQYSIVSPEKFQIIMPYGPSSSVAPAACDASGSSKLCQAAAPASRVKRKEGEQLCINLKHREEGEGTLVCMEETPFATSLFASRKRTRILTENLPLKKRWTLSNRDSTDEAERTKFRGNPHLGACEEVETCSLMLLAVTALGSELLPP